MWTTVEDRVWMSYYIPQKYGMQLFIHALISDMFMKKDAGRNVAPYTNHQHIQARGNNITYAWKT